MIIKENINSFHLWKKSFLLHLRSQDQMRQQSTWGRLTFVVTLEPSNHCPRAFGDLCRHSLRMPHPFRLCAMTVLLINRLGTTRTAQVAVEVVAGRSFPLSWTVTYPRVTTYGIRPRYSRTWHPPPRRLKEESIRRCQIKVYRLAHSGSQAEELTVPLRHPPFHVHTISPSLHPLLWEDAPRLTTSLCGRGIPSGGVHGL